MKAIIFEPSGSWAKDPERYSARCERLRKRADRRKTARVQLLFECACVLLIVVLAVALAVK